MRRLGSILSTIGILLLLAAFILAVYNIQDDNRAKKSSDAVIQSLASEATGRIESFGRKAEEETQERFFSLEETVLETEETIPDYKLDPNRKMPVQEINGQAYIGVLELPELSLTLPVMSDWDYPKLKDAPCRFSGSAYHNDLVIMAHNFQSHFGKIGSLSSGSRIIFTDMDENVFTYQVVQTEILNPTEVEDVTSGMWDLTLFTCTTGGQYRVAVRCESV